MRGIALGPTDMLEAADVYPAIDGTWQQCSTSLVGSPLTASAAVWVRPSKAMLGMAAAALAFAESEMI